MALYDIPIHTLQGDDTSLGDYKGKTLLLVNVASKCGLTPQYEGLERLQKTYGDRGFSVIGFPCNQFMGQEPGTSEEIAQFCSATYGVTFPLMEKIDVNGDDRSPDLRRADGDEGRRGQRRRHHVELREVPRVARGQRRGAVPAPGGAGGRHDCRRHRGAADRLTSSGFAASIFDMDGLLIDSEILWHEAEIEILGGLGVPLAVEGCRSTKGMFVGEVTAHWYGLHPWPGATPTPDEVAVSIVDRVIELIVTKGVLKPGARHAIDLCRSRGLPLAVASSSQYRLIDAALAHFGLRDSFELVHSAEDEEYGKPHPAVFLSAAAKLGAPPRRCLVWEDAPAGVLAAKASSMTCIAVPEQGEGDQPAFGLADLVVRLAVGRHQRVPRRTRAGTHYARFWLRLTEPERERTLGDLRGHAPAGLPPRGNAPRE